MTAQIIRPAVGRAQTGGVDQRKPLRSGLMLAVVVWLAGLVAWQLPGADRFEREVTLPWLFAQRGPLPAPAEATIFAIDSASARRLGLPSRLADWPRGIHADLIGRAAQGRAAVIAVDVYFARARSGDGDAALAGAISDAGNVVLFGNLERQVQSVPGTQAQGQLRVDRLRRPYKPLADAAAAVATFALPKSPTRVDTVWTYHPAMPTLATLPAAAVQVQAGSPSCPATPQMTRAQRAACDLTVGAHERMLNFYGPPRTLNIIPAADVLLGQVPDVAGRAVFIGHVEPYFPNQLDSFLTAVSRPDGLDLSGVEIATTAYLNLLRDESLKPASPGIIAGGLLVGALVLAASSLPLRPVGASVLAVTLASAAYLAVLTAFGRFHVWLPLAPWWAEVMVALLGTLVLRARDSGRERQQVAAAFRHYLPAHVVERVARETGSAPSQSRPVPLRAVCLVSDAAGYTTVSEHLPAAALRELINQYYAALLAPIRAQGGIVTDIVGDSALALWPVRHGGIAQQLRACRAALGIQQALAGFGGGLPTRVGLHVGELVLGPVGALDHYEYRAVGDVVNTASRIEVLNKRLGTQVLASHEVIGSLTGVDCRRVGRFRLAGKTDAVVLYELLAAPVAARPLFEWALDAFAAGDVGAARDAFAEVLATDPGDTVAAFYLASLQGQNDKLPSDGVIVVPK
ncbi:MAG: CHASE2 domain-containing protein [Immundisolibacter sp.]|uniref:CHASE2 domain-containing protein n=1 Tax=Immundisolibacter sp. TaxID=1934948 RepID=UPI003EE02287